MSELKKEQQVRYDLVKELIIKGASSHQIIRDVDLLANYIIHGKDETFQERVEQVITESIKNPLSSVAKALKTQLNAV